MSAASLWRWTLLLLFGALLSLPTRATAHAGSNAWLDVDAQTAAVSLRWDLAIRDLDFALGLDANGDGAITWGETLAASAAIRSYAQAHLLISANGSDCPLSSLDSLQIADRLDGRYAVLHLRAACAALPRQLSLRYEALFDLDASHRTQLRLSMMVDGRTQIRNGVLAPDRRELLFEASASEGSVLRQYFHEGLWHVWTGWDHLLFLAALFLPAVLRRERGAWVPVASLGEAALETLRIVTAFTLAHALTLCLAALGIVQLPTRLVESLVAATVLFAGLNNLLPMVHRRLAWLAGGFGLIHGSAIAGALLELGLPVEGRLWSLLGFNLGVEAAQLLLLALVLPLSFVCRRAPLYRYAVLLPGSALVAVAGLVWLLDRAFAMGWRLPI